jgi:hypothetical protein
VGRRLPIIILVGIIGLRGATAQAEVTNYSPLQQRMSNCGLNVTVFASRYFGGRTSVEELAKQLNVGELRDRALSLKDIRDALMQQGLEVSAFKDASVSDMLEAARPDGNSIVVFHVDNKKTVGHYLILLARRENHVLLVDPGEGAGIAWREEAEFRERVQGVLTGVYLVVRAKSPSQWISTDAPRSRFQTSAKLGPGPIVVELPLFNPGDKPVTFNMIKGDCGCFVGGSPMPLTLGPKGTSVLKLQFLREAFGTGKVFRKVALADDLTGESFKAIIELTVDVESRPEEQVLSWIPRVLDLGVVTDAAKIQRSHSFMLRVPHAVQVQSVVPSSSSIRVRTANVKLPSSLADPDAKYKWMAYEVVLVNVPDVGEVNESLTIRSDDPVDPEVVVPIHADIRKPVTRSSGATTE